MCLIRCFLVGSPCNFGLQQNALCHTWWLNLSHPHHRKVLVHWDFLESSFRLSSDFKSPVHFFFFFLNVASNSRDTSTKGFQATINQISIYLFNSTYRIMLAIVSSELKLHWAKGCLLKTVFFFFRHLHWNCLDFIGHGKNFSLNYRRKKKEPSVVFTSWYVQSGSTALETRCIWFMLCIIKQKGKT